MLNGLHKIIKVNFFFQKGKTNVKKDEFSNAKKDVNLHSFFKSKYTLWEKIKVRASHHLIESHFFIRGDTNSSL